MNKLVVLLIISLVVGFAKQPNKEQLKKDLFHLADDKLEGREAGTQREN